MKIWDSVFKSVGTANLFNYEMLNRCPIFLQLAFFDTSRKSWSIRENDTTIPKSRVVRDLDEESDSSGDRFTQKTFPVKPIAESSPIEKRNSKIAKSLSPAEESFLEKKIQISCSLYSLLFVVSVSFNIAVLWYLVLA